MKCGVTKDGAIILMSVLQKPCSATWNGDSRCHVTRAWHKMEAYTILGCLSFLLFICLGLCMPQINEISGGMLYPRESESRQIQDLNGMWKFRADRSPSRRQGFADDWWAQPLETVS